MPTSPHGPSENWRWRLRTGPVTAVQAIGLRSQPHGQGPVEPGRGDHITKAPTGRVRGACCKPLHGNSRSRRRRRTAAGAVRATSPRSAVSGQRVVGSESGYQSLRRGSLVSGAGPQPPRVVDAGVDQIVAAGRRCRTATRQHHCDNQRNPTATDENRRCRVERRGGGSGVHSRDRPIGKRTESWRRRTCIIVP